MRRLAILGGSILLVASAALAAEPHVSTIPDGMLPAAPGGAPGGNGVPCDVLIRYDDGTDDQVGSGFTLGIGQRLGIIAQAPSSGAAAWRVQSAGFFSEFWLTPGDVDVQITSIADSGNTTTETLFVDSAGTWEIAFSAPIQVAPGEEFAVMLCGGPDTHGVTGEDFSSPDGRSYFSGAACSPDSVVGNGDADLMIWACVTPVSIQEIPALGTWGLGILGLVLAGLGAFWVATRRRSEPTDLPA